jgi:gamma-glutamylcyclotransferase (GGCT)/AIG2-like uncharacterized protein YtfP
MADLDLLAALESMTDLGTNSTTYIDANRERWMKLFNLSATEAETAMESQLNPLSRSTISDAQWAFLSFTPATQGHDRESYAYHVSLLSQNKIKKRKTEEQNMDKSIRYIFKLKEPFHTVEKVCSAASLTESPPTSDNGEAVMLDFTARAALSSQYPDLEFVRVRIGKSAEKALSSFSIAPTLGVDATLPQHRIDTLSSPLQDTYPVPYFFYGTLADGEKLTSLLGLSEAPMFVPAVVRRGRLKMWGGKYRALVDGGEREELQGWMYVVQSEEHEDALRTYENGNYEVVRCEMRSEDGGRVKGLTFRYCGRKEMLS